MAVDQGRTTESGLEDLALGEALSDLEDDFFRTGVPVSYADVDRAAERHALSAADHAGLVERASAAGYLLEADGREPEPRPPARGPLAASEDLDSFALLLRDVVRYPLLDARAEVELARAIEAGERARQARSAGN